MIVKIAKLSVAPDAAHGAASWWEITPGSSLPPGKSLPVDYEILGLLTSPILPGRPLTALRFQRNGVEALGYFSSSEVREIRVVTHNSIYQITAA